MDRRQQNQSSIGHRQMIAAALFLWLSVPVSAQQIDVRPKGRSFTLAHDLSSQVLPFEPVRWDLINRGSPFVQPLAVEWEAGPFEGTQIEARADTAMRLVLDQSSGRNRWQVLREYGRTGAGRLGSDAARTQLACYGPGHARILLTIEFLSDNPLSLPAQSYTTTVRATVVGL